MLTPGGQGSTPPTMSMRAKTSPKSAAPSPLMSALHEPSPTYTTLTLVGEYTTSNPGALTPGNVPLRDPHVSTVNESPTHGRNPPGSATWSVPFRVAAPLTTTWSAPPASISMSSEAVGLMKSAP